MHRLRSISTAAAIAVTLQLWGARAQAQTLRELTHYCEQLESYWRARPAVVPNQAGAAICYGYMSAFHGLTRLVGVLWADTSTCHETSEGGLEGGPFCQPTLSICTPKGITFSQELAVFLAYARGQVTLWDDAAWGHYLIAMQTAFPCKAQSPTPAAK